VGARIAAELNCAMRYQWEANVLLPLSCLRLGSLRQTE
jgi:hypothetical protein